MKKDGKILGWIKANWLFSIFIIFMTIYYLIHMFTIKPWYDELYTYFSFISRGPVYAAIHWPVPNNHVFYSVLSAFLDYFGNPYIGLRGISFLMAVLNLCLIYNFAIQFMNRYFAAGTSFLYASFYLVNSLSIQGRGYTLETTCYLLALLSLYKICTKDGGVKYYVIYALSLTAGLYTIVSSTFWVFPVCLIGGLFLLLQKQYQKLAKLIVTSIIAALMTLFLYGVIWLAIGSNLLSKDAESIYYGIYQVTIILKNPIAALTTGMNYMLATPYVQSIARGEVIRELLGYLQTLFNLYWQNMGTYIIILLMVSICIFGVLAWRNREKKSAFFLSLYICCSIICMPVMLIIQSVQPYKRVFAFFAVALSMVITSIFSLAADNMKEEKWKKRISLGMPLCLCIFAVGMLVSNMYCAPYADRENRIAEIVRAEDAESIRAIYYTDDFQKYVLKFYYDVEPHEVSLEEADTVLVSNQQLDPNNTQVEWPVLISGRDLNLSYIRQHFQLIRESEFYSLYQREK